MRRYNLRSAVSEIVSSQDKLIENGGNNEDNGSDRRKKFGCTSLFDWSSVFGRCCIAFLRRRKHANMVQPPRQKQHNTTDDCKFP